MRFDKGDWVLLPIETTLTAIARAVKTLSKDGPRKAADEGCPLITEVRLILFLNPCRRLTMIPVLLG